MYMTRQEFVEALKIQTSDAAVFGTEANLERPPGRRPRERDVKLAQWYGGLSDAERPFVRAAIQEAAELAVFSFLGILDGISAIENGPNKGELRLLYRKDEEELLLNDPRDEFLHDMYNALCQESSPTVPQRSESNVYEVGPASELREHQGSNDGMDLHSVPRGTATEAPNPVPPAIALPKNEHRKL
jgi:hypothetical protein